MRVRIHRRTKVDNPRIRTPLTHIDQLLLNTVSSSPLDQLAVLGKREVGREKEATHVIPGVLRSTMKPVKDL